MEEVDGDGSVRERLNMYTRLVSRSAPIMLCSSGGYVQLSTADHQALRWKETKNKARIQPSKILV
jgi:hypothetical protein